ncbi:Uncharacterised protein [Streptococcus pneumoniae]|nr:Uncharacterised protein [Streptococcus pneumoniae]
MVSQNLVVAFNFSFSIVLNTTRQETFFKWFLVEQVFLHEVTIRLWIVPIKAHILIKVDTG